MRLLKLLLLPVILAATFTAQAQEKTSTLPGSVKGIVRDTVHNYVLKSATASIYKAADHSLLSYQITNNYGVFNFKNLPVDIPLKVEVTHVGYTVLNKAFIIPANTNAIDLKTLIISPADVSLKEVVISIPPITMKGDTLEFNAAAFKLDSNAVVEDLLKKIPNITLWGDGQITVNGREVKSLLVNGKEFFGGNKKIALQNIAKNAVDKIQVYDIEKEKKDPLNSSLEMNIKLKKGKDIGYFGKVGAGYGTAKRYEADGSVNVFSPKMQLALIGASNNINKVAPDVYTLMSNSTFKGVGTNIEYQPDFRSSGLTRSNTLGATFSYNFIENPTFDNKTELKANYFQQNRNNVFLSRSETTTTTGEADRIFNQQNSENRYFNDNHNFDTEFEWKKKGKLLTLKQSFVGNSFEGSNETFTNAQDKDNELTSTSNSTNKNKGRSDSFNLTARYLSRDFTKPESFEAFYMLSYKDRTEERVNHTDFNSFTDPASDRMFNRRYMTSSDHIGQNLSVAFKDLKNFLFGKTRLLGIDFSIKNNLKLDFNKDHNFVEDYSKVTSMYEKNAYLSNRTQSNTIEEMPGISFERTFAKSLTNRYQQNWSVNANLNQVFIYQDNRSEKSFQNINRSYTRFIPDASIRFSDFQYGDNYRSYELSYKTGFSIPTLFQLAPLIDSTAFYNIQKGNLNLKGATTRSLNFAFNHTDQTKNNTLNYNFNIQAGLINNNITDSTFIESDNRRTVYLTNANGRKFLNFSGSIRKEFKLKSSELQIGLTNSTNVFKNPNFLNGVFNFSNDLYTNSDLSVHYNYQNLAVEASQKYSTYRSKQEVFNTKYSGKNIASTLSSSYNVTKKFTLNSNVTFNRSGSLNSDNINFAIWNASVVYRFLKGNNAEFKFSALDLLHQNNSVVNYSSANSFTVGTQNVLQHYFMTTIAYYPRKFGKN